jgi:hypothetical protein
MKRKIYASYWILIVLLMLVVTQPDLATTHAQQSNRAGLVVRFGDGSLITRCVEFNESTISGYDLLTRSGLNIIAAFDSGQGAAICSIENTGCPVESCLTCDMPNYWSYWHLVDGVWVYSQAGSSGHSVGDGDVEGWSWGSGGPPPVVRFDQICAMFATDTPLPPTDTPVSTATPTNTPFPPTNTPVPPTATPLPPTPEAWFRLDNNPIAAGTCTNVRWDTSNAQKIYLDGEDVSANGSREICPTASQEYTLRLVNAAGDQTYTLVLGITGTAPTGTFTPQPAIAASATPTGLPQSAPTATASQSDAAPLQATVTLTPSPVPTAQPAASPLSSPTPARQVALSLASAARDAQPTPPPPAPPTAEPATGEQKPSSSGGEDLVSAAVPIGYIVFSLTAGGLLGWLVFAMRRRK